uniref:Uncharacterized protein n=1 Tax=Glossina austeni TaxID=7395 RepID=A0A1A9UNH4_GLOAU
MLDIERSGCEIRLPFDLRGVYISCGFSFLTGIPPGTGFVNQQKLTIKPSNEQMLRLPSLFLIVFLVPLPTYRTCTIATGTHSYTHTDIFTYHRIFDLNKRHLPNTNTNNYIRTIQ